MQKQEEKDLDLPLQQNKEAAMGEAESQKKGEACAHVCMNTSPTVKGELLYFYFK